MGKILDFVMVGGDWEKFQKIQYLKNMPKSIAKSNGNVLLNNEEDSDFE